MLSLRSKFSESLLRRMIAVSMVLLLAFMSGCNEVMPPEAPMDGDPTEAEPEPTEYVSPFREVTATSELNYLVRNPQVEKYTEIEESPDFREMMMSIDGLKDKSVEASMNERVERLHNEVKEMIPPYRGIRKLIPQDAELTASYISSSLNFSYYNLMSVRVSGSKTYDSGNPNEPVYLEYMETLNLDLNTGEEIRIGDLFKNNVDYKEMLNDLIKTYLDKEFATEEYSEWFSSPNLISPFRGIRDDQKFLLSENALVLVIDYDTPEFDTKTYNSFINIPLEDIRDSLAIRERFYDEKTSLFTVEEKPVKSLITNYNKNVVGERVNEEKGKLTLYKEYRYPDNFDEALTNLFMNFIQIDEEKIESLSEEGTRQINYYEDSSASYKGEYISFYKNINLSIDEGDNIFSSEFKTLTREGKELSLGDIFIEGYDYEPFIKSRLEEAASQELTLDSSEIDVLYESMNFGLNATSLYFSTVPINVQQNENYPIAFTIEFEEIGCENLKLFN